MTTTISSGILGKHLHKTATEQLKADLRSKGYDVQRQAPIGSAVPPFRADVLARRGNDAIVYEVKVLGDRLRGNLTRASEAAREIGAKFHAILVNPQRRVGIEIEGAPGLVLRAFSEAGPAPLAEALSLLEGEWHPVRVTDVQLDDIAWRADAVQVSGSAVLTLDQPALGASQDDPWHDSLEQGAHLPVHSTLWLDQDRRFTRSPRLDVDISELDALP